MDLSGDEVNTIITDAKKFWSSVGYDLPSNYSRLDQYKQILAIEAALKARGFEIDDLFDSLGWGWDLVETALESFNAASIIQVFGL